QPHRTLKRVVGHRRPRCLVLKRSAFDKLDEIDVIEDQHLVSEEF
ncbi:MAG: hypothetical protein H6716_24630, partial [Polyangiaceae bacterium]|nr:hypothetical protein [Polyangiaceae bacterium]